MLLAAAVGWGVIYHPRCQAHGRLGSLCLILMWMRGHEEWESRIEFPEEYSFALVPDVLEEVGRMELGM